jgi:hypothetical protein
VSAPARLPQPMFSLSFNYKRLPHQQREHLCQSFHGARLRTAFFPRRRLKSTTTTVGRRGLTFFRQQEETP